MGLSRSITVDRRPPYLTDEWLASHGVADLAEIQAYMRNEDEVMRPEVLRAIRPTRLSFSRSLIRRMTAEAWKIALTHSTLDADGVGTLIYSISATGHDLHFAVVSNAPDGPERLGRVCDMKYDFLGSLRDGEVDLAAAEADLKELAEKIWSGRTGNDTLGWTVANRSVRFFDHAVEQLSLGKQPNTDLLSGGGGYIIRNAGWLGNGRFGSKSWLSLAADHPLSQPYHCDIFALYLWRQVGHDIVEHIARSRNPRLAAALSPHVRRSLGVGNSSGVGMVAALVRWPAWMSAYTYPRELALGFAKSRLSAPAPEAVAVLKTLMSRAASYYDEQPGSPVSELADPRHLSQVFRNLTRLLDEYGGQGTFGGVKVVNFAQQLLEMAEADGGLEAREQINSFLIELCPEFADAAAGLISRAMAIPRRIEAGTAVGEVRSLIDRLFAWAMAIDRSLPGAQEYFWYRSEDVGENRRGERAIDPGLEKETFVDVAGSIQHLAKDLAAYACDKSIGEFLLDYPEHAHAASRVEVARLVPYSEIRGNIIDANFLPMDGIRFLLSTMGLESSHPFNTRWVRGVFLQGAPDPNQVAEGVSDLWIYPSMKQS